MSQLSHGGLSKKQRKARTAFRLSLLMMILLLMMLLQMVIMFMIMAVKMMMILVVAVMTNRELDKGRVTLPNRMNFRENSKRPSTPPPSFSENYIATFFWKTYERSQNLQ